MLCFAKITNKEGPLNNEKPFLYFMRMMYKPYKVQIVPLIMIIYKKKGPVLDPIRNTHHYFCLTYHT